MRVFNPFQRSNRNNVTSQSELIPSVPPVGVKRTIARNVVWNWAGMGANMIAGFVVAPFLIHRLGDSTYGLWVLIASLTSYFGLLDIGVRGSVARQIAFYRAKNDVEGGNATLNTALAMLCGAATLALIGTLGAIFLFFYIIPVPADQVQNVQLALLLVGLNLVLWLPLSMFDAMLWAYQRFDLINAVDITTVVVRVGLTFYLIGRGHGLVGLALINLLCLAGSQAIKGILIFRLDSTLRLSPRYLKREAARNLLGMGFWNFLLCMSNVANNQVGPLIIGARLGAGLVTPFSIAARLLAYGRDFLVSSTGVLTPLAISLHAEDKTSQQQKLFLEGSKYCLGMALFFLSLFVLLGKPMIALWMGPDLAWSSQLLLILALGEVLPMSQWVAYSIILGKYRHRELACVSIVENMLAIPLALMLIGPYGLIGVCIAFAIPGAIFRGLFQLLYASRLVHVSIGRYVMQVLLPILAAWALPAIGLAALVQWKSPQTWPALFLYTAGYGACHVLTVGGLLMYQRRKPQDGASDDPNPQKRSVARRLAGAIQNVW